MTSSNSRDECMARLYINNVKPGNAIYPLPLMLMGITSNCRTSDLCKLTVPGWRRYSHNKKQSGILVLLKVSFSERLDPRTVLGRHIVSTRGVSPAHAGGVVCLLDDTQMVTGCR